MARILIVDDEARNRRLLELVVNAEGHSTLHAANGSEALVIARTECPDLVLLDLMMPEMDGFQIVRHLKLDPATRSIPVIVVTALDDVAARQRVLASGADDFVGKPLDRWELLVRVQRLLGEPAAGDDRPARGRAP